MGLQILMRFQIIWLLLLPSSCITMVVILQFVIHVVVQMKPPGHYSQRHAKFHITNKMKYFYGPNKSLFENYGTDHKLICQK